MENILTGILYFYLLQLIFKNTYILVVTLILKQ